MRWLQFLGLLLLLPLLFRFGAFIVGLLVRLVRGAFEVSAVARGTPLGAALLLAVLAVLLYVLIRQRRAKRKRDANNS